MFPNIAHSHFFWSCSVCCQCNTGIHGCTYLKWKPPYYSPTCVKTSKILQLTSNQQTWFTTFTCFLFQSNSAAQTNFLYVSLILFSFSGSEFSCSVVCLHQISVLILSNEEVYLTKDMKKGIPCIRFCPRLSWFGEKFESLKKLGWSADFQYQMVTELSVYQWYRYVVSDTEASKTLTDGENLQKKILQLFSSLFSRQRTHNQHADYRNLTLWLPFAGINKKLIVSMARYRCFIFFSHLSCLWKDYPSGYCIKAFCWFSGCRSMWFD